jgi:capsular polysaccharide biosynthesis protein
MAVSFRHHLVVIWQRRWWVVMSCLLMGAIGTALALWQSRAYTAEAQLVLDVRQDPMNGGFMSALNMSTQLEVIKSDKVTARAAALLLDSDDLQLRAALLGLMKGKAPSIKGLSTFLQAGLTVEPVRGSNVIALTCMAPSPELAVAAVNAVAHAAMDVSIEMKVDPTKESAVWLQGQSKSARAALEAAQAKLSRYQQEKGIVVTDDRMNEESARLSALESALVDAEAQGHRCARAWCRRRGRGRAKCGRGQRAGAAVGRGTQAAGGLRETGQGASATDRAGGPGRQSATASGCRDRQGGAVGVRIRASQPRQGGPAQGHDRCAEEAGAVTARGP